MFPVRGFGKGLQLLDASHGKESILGKVTVGYIWGLSRTAEALAAGPP